MHGARASKHGAYARFHTQLNAEAPASTYKGTEGESGEFAGNPTSWQHIHIETGHTPVYATPEKNPNIDGNLREGYEPTATPLE
jgi:hypothetical protein